MIRKLTLIQVLLLIATAGMAQTPDGQTPAEEDVCAGLRGQAFGLCNAYCEAMDCDSEAPNASPKACSRTRDRFLLATGGDDLPCVVRCPCAYNLDFTQWPTGEVQLICQPGATGGASVVGDEPMPPFVGAAWDEVQGSFCGVINANGVPTQSHFGFTGQEAHACSADILAYLLALRAARPDLIFSGDDLDSCEPIPVPE